MKKFMVVLFVFLFLITGCSNNNTKSEKTQNLYGKVAQDGREVSVNVVFDNGSILDIEVSTIISDDENSEEVAKAVAYEIISQQSLSVDAVAGAAKTSNDVINAVSLALESGGISSELFIDKKISAKEESQEKNNNDVLVIGSGAAGLAAAIQAAEDGKQVLVVEKMPIAGGSTFLSGAEISIPENVLSIEQPQNDSPGIMVEDIVKASQNTANKKLVSIICNNIADTVLWLKDSVKAEFNNDFYKVNGHSIARTTFPDGGGAALINKMVLRAEELGVKILYNMNAKDIIQDNNGKVLGINVQRGEEIFSFFAEDRVVIATGGFSANKAMREKYNEQLGQLDLNILTSCSQGITGDGIIMGQKVGAKVVDMQYIQLYPYTNPATGIHFYMDNKRIDAGAFYINKEGKRFVREDQRRGIVASAVLQQTDSMMYEVFTQEILDEILVNELAHKEFNQWVYQGVIAKGDTIGECAEVFLLDKKEVTKTLNRYNSFIKNGNDEDFQREINYTLLDKGPYYMLEGVPSIHYTLGGLKIDEYARVLDQDDKPIKNLYAAGEVTGGIYGKDRLGACAVPDALVFGRIAGGYEAK
jgi:urocanate reductase